MVKMSMMRIIVRKERKRRGISRQRLACVKESESETHRLQGKRVLERNNGRSSDEMRAETGLSPLGGGVSDRVGDRLRSSKELETGVIQRETKVRVGPKWRGEECLDLSLGDFDSDGGSQKSLLEAWAYSSLLNFTVVRVGLCQLRDEKGPGGFSPTGQRVQLHRKLQVGGWMHRPDWLDRSNH